MADTKSETTFKHRNIIDDILDLGMTIAMIAWYFTGIDIDKETLAMVGAGGASARVTLRRILVKLWGPKLGIEADPSDDEEPAPSDTPTEAPDDSEESEDEAG